MPEIDAKRFATALVCDVQFRNDMGDGTVITGIIADFVYEDNSTSVSNANVHLTYGQTADLYSNDKCVKRISVGISATRPNGDLESSNGADPQAPAGKCWVHTIWILQPTRAVSPDEVKAGKPIKLELVR